MTALEFLLFSKTRAAEMDLQSVKKALEPFAMGDPGAKGLLRIRAARQERYNTLFGILSDARLVNDYEAWKGENA